MFFIFYKNRFKKSKKDSKYSQSSQITKGAIIAVIIILVLFLSLLTYQYLLIPISHYKAEENKDELVNIINELIKEADTNETKTKAILKWFNWSENNIYNNYRLFKQGKLLYRVLGDKIQIYSTYPYLAVRSYNDEDSLWILTTRFGHCGEYALIFEDMAIEASLQTRRVICKGEDHVWNEVYINNSWVIVDSTAVNLPKRTGYSLSSDFMEKKVAGDLNSDIGNVSYIYAVYPDGSKEDITYRYTDLTRINVLVLDSEGLPVDGIYIKVDSINRIERRYSGLYNKTNEKGLSSFTLGGGKYLFNAKNKDFIPLYGEIKDNFNENETYNITITLKRDWTKNENLLTTLIIAILVVLVSIFIYIKRRKLKN